MKRTLVVILGMLLMQSAWSHGHPVAVDDSMPDVQRIRFCERVRDHALQRFITATRAGR
jgi:hypothetical protein